MHHPAWPAAPVRLAPCLPYVRRAVGPGRGRARLAAAVVTAAALSAAGSGLAAESGDAPASRAADGAGQRPAPGPSVQAVATRPGRVPAAGAPADAVVLYRSTMPNGRTVIGDRPEPGARRTEAIGAALAVDRADTVRARQEREYWRQRAEAFAARHEQRQREFDAERSERVGRAERERALYASRVLLAPPVVYAGGLGRFDPFGFASGGAYATSPGAAGRNLGALGSTGLGFGAAFGASSGFIGSGFATSGR